MKKASGCVLFVMAAVLAGPSGSAQIAGGTVVERLDPALDAIVSSDAKLELLDDHFGTSEGPIWVQEGQNGYLLFSDIPANVIYKWTPGSGVSVFLENSGYTGTDISNVGAQSTSGRLAVIVLGSNGLALDPQGRVVMATHGDRNIVRLERDGRRVVLADRYDGKRFSGPNDLVVKSNGALYFTDNIFGLRGRDKSPARELPFNGVYLVKDGRVDLMDKDPQGGSPNGIALSPDEKYLYVGSGGKIVRYEIRPDDILANPQVVIASGTDGMKADEKGNLYLTTRGGVVIVSPEGRHLGTIRLPTLAGIAPTTTNVAFGDADRKTLYITARTQLYRIRLNVAGPRWGPHR
jgi:gluconolactonase